eukprot:TRINITY_DN90274_c0_g1_i1.p1 TRINITY_DN90274_c0_g1~~TRINITY_DN90274_c0_g1_i1.p1  ORF type:complete len:420 (-),score=124.67 TRINITY_DN90274_c0_g1_i1:257-1516(-)
MAGVNPSKWPEFEQLGRDFHDHITPALEQVLAGEDIDEEAQSGLQRLDGWLASPCFVTVKLDGTNVGVDDSGLIVGRNFAVAPGETYSKVDVWKLLDGYAEKAALLKQKLNSVLETDKLAQVMLYGELVIQGKYDYVAQGIYKQWLCFGAVLRPEALEDEAAVRRMTGALRAADLNASAKEDRILLAPNKKLFALFAELNIDTVATGYHPGKAGCEKGWADAYDAQSLHEFDSMRCFLQSDWVQRFLLPANRVPNGEGVVIASAADGRLFKFKHGGEELGKVPRQLEDIMTKLSELQDATQKAVFPPDILAVAEILHKVATYKPAGAENAVAKMEKVDSEDTEAIAVFQSALTKVDDLDSVFERGTKNVMEKALIEQVAADLVKDYDADAKAAQGRATKIVRQGVGQRFGEWKKRAAGS